MGAMTTSEVAGYQELVHAGAVQRRLEHLAQELAELAERLNATICKLARASTGHVEFWDQYERDVDVRLDELRRAVSPD
jgi:hypothetical protein